MWDTGEDGSRDFLPQHLHQPPPIITQKPEYSELEIDCSTDSIDSDIYTLRPKTSIEVVPFMFFLAAFLSLTPNRYILYCI